MSYESYQGKTLLAVLIPLKLYLLQPLPQRAINNTTINTTVATPFTPDPAISPGKGPVLLPEYFRIPRFT